MDGWMDVSYSLSISCAVVLAISTALCLWLDHGCAEIRYNTTLVCAQNDLKIDHVRPIHKQLGYISENVLLDLLVNVKDHRPHH